MKKLIVLLMCAGLVSVASAFSFSEDWESVTAGSGQNNLPSEWTTVTPGGWWMVVADPNSGSNALKPDDSPSSGQLQALYTDINLSAGLDYTVEADVTWVSTDWPWTGFAFNIQGDGLALMFRIRGGNDVSFNMTDIDTTSVSSALANVDDVAGWASGETWHVTASVTHNVTELGELGMTIEASGYDTGNAAETFTIPQTFIDYDNTYSGYAVNSLKSGGGFGIVSRANRDHYVDNISVSGTLVPAEILIDDESVVVSENGSSDTFDVVLATAPTDTVNLTLNYDANDITLSDSFLTFTTSNWDTPQTVTATSDPADDDPYVLGDAEVPVNILAASTGDTLYNGIQKNINVVIVDDEVVGPIGTYVDATDLNTEAADGGPTWYTADETTYDTNTGLWWLRSESWANEGTFFQTDNLEIAGTDPQEYDNRLLKTTLTGLTQGEEYEIRAVYWGWADQYNDPPGTLGTMPNIRTGFSSTDADNEVYSVALNYPRITGDVIGVYSTYAFTGNTGPFSGYHQPQILLGTAVADGSGEIAAYVNGFKLGINATSQTQYDGLTYQKVLLDIVETDSTTAVANGSSDTFTVALAENADGSDVYVSLSEIGDIADVLTISPELLTFSSGSYTTPQVVTVTGKADAFDYAQADLINSTVVLKATSADTNFDGYTTTVLVYDHDCGAWSVSPVDFNADCEVDIDDLADFASLWLDCTDPADGTCQDARPWTE